MRISTSIKKIFSDDSLDTSVKKKEVEVKTNTKKVLVSVSVITKAFQFFVGKGHIEGVCLLRGKRLCEEYLLISDIYCCPNAKATPTNVKIPPISFGKAATIKDGNYVVGWCHSHPGFRVFISKTDEATQKDFQALFPDAVALVMNPFDKNGIEFKFFRYKDGDKYPKEIEYDYLVIRNEN